ncbi:F-box protein CPR1-like [Papaver somniferum]|uniref:F-box protein CPR1-like n=1 Tax=Papaver somniferum TaxID=3469 RepID=UPI000E7042B7|nr:F-box protein CPR1-like [Papaver somniferum]
MCIQKLEALTYDSSFVKLHQSRSHSQLFIMMYKDSSIQVYTPKYEFQGGEALYKVTIPWSRVVILKPINGLFSFIDILNGLSCVYNLGTRQVIPWVSIPVPPKTGSLVTAIPTYGFGFDPSTGKHKILCIWDISRFGGKVEHIVQVFTLGENEWRRIDELPPVKPFREEVYANGSIYRRNCGHKFCQPPDVEVILAFDVGTEKFRVIQIPDVIFSSHRNPEVSGRAEYLLEVDGHIALIDRLDKNVVKLWRSYDDYRLKTEVTWLGQTFILHLECSIRELFYFHVVQGTRQIIIKPWEARDFVTLYIYDIDTNTFRDIKISDLSPSFIYGMFTTPETLLPVQKIKKFDGAS